MSILHARKLGEELSRQFGPNGPPVDVERIVRAYGIPIVYADLGSEVSGLLISGGEPARICIQEQDVPARRRFTLGHELAHFLLRHQFEPGEHVHVDRGNYISQRGSLAAAGVDPKEMEANQFAAALLMPRWLLEPEVRGLSSGPVLDQHVTELAKRFEVSEQAMTIRLMTLRLL